MGLSLDVIYHLVEDNIYQKHLKLLFEQSKRFVLIYSSNREEEAGGPAHVKHRKFTDDVAREHKKMGARETHSQRVPIPRRL